MKKLLFAFMALLLFAVNPSVAKENFTFDIDQTIQKSDSQIQSVVLNDTLNYEIQNFGVITSNDVGLKDLSNSEINLVIAEKKPSRTFNHIIILHIDPGRCSLNVTK